ncbi:MAG: hypothetical protein F6K25_12045 [Okeania sp. SIO2G4]|nr:MULTISPECIES: hypothetical protein [unclassified Okeania]NEP39536.1 hypothetical protein [Okeania sp. SIO2H7]NEP93386.1 hypothetical protein [Okeania sp. SIO2F5]NEQ91398.1 hypothetical protein [Okeania sp. SIO2G4]
MKQNCSATRAIVKETTLSRSYRIVLSLLLKKLVNFFVYRLHGAENCLGL